MVVVADSVDENIVKRENTDNGKQTEYNRYANEDQTEIDEADAGLTDDRQSLGLALTFKMTSGEITAEEYEREMQKLFGN